MSFNRFYVISPLALVAVSACRSPYAGSNVNGAIVKGPLSNALVFLDLDGDGILDDNEVSVRTDSDGSFSINTTASAYTIVALTDETTVDSSSGSTLAGIMLSAPQGAAVVTPTTTLMEEGGLTAEEVAEVLNLPDGVDPLTFNPFDVDENDADAVAAALEVEKIAQQVMSAVTSFAAVAEGAGLSEGSFEAALNSVVEVVKAKAENLDDDSAAAADKSLDFTNAADLNLIKGNVADEAEKVATEKGVAGFNKATVVSRVDKAAESIKNVNDQIDTVTDLSSDAAKGAFSNISLLSQQSKSGTFTFDDAANVAAAANNLAPQDLKIVEDLSDVDSEVSTIMEGTNNLVIGSLLTIDEDQPDDGEFIYSIKEFGDYELFEINANNELVLKATPVYSEQSSYELHINVKDEGGKDTTKEFKIDVFPDPHENFLVKFTVNHIVDDGVVVGSDYGQKIADTESAYSDFMSRLFTNMDSIDDAIELVFSGGGGSPSDSELQMAEGGMPPSESEASFDEMLQAILDGGGSLPTVTETADSGFVVDYINTVTSDAWEMTVNITGYQTDSDYAFGGKVTYEVDDPDPDAEDDSTIDKTDVINHFDPLTWTVAGGFTGVSLAVNGSDVVEVSITGTESTTMNITAKSGFTELLLDEDFADDDVASIQLVGDFSNIDGEHIFDVLDQLSLSPSSESEGHDSMSPDSMSPDSDDHDHDEEGSDGPAYTIDTVYVYGKDGNGLTSSHVAKAEFDTGFLSLTIDDYTMSLDSDSLPDYITAGEVFDYANVDLFDVEAVVANKDDGYFVLSHSEHGDLLIIDSNMSDADADATITLGEDFNFGDYEQVRFVSDSNDVVAAFIDFGSEIDDADFQTYWNEIDDITDMFADIA